MTLAISLYRRTVSDDALIGFAGVVIGGLLAGGIEFLRRWLDRRGSRRLAARVLADEISSVLADAELSLKQQELRISDMSVLESAWREHRVAFESIDWSDWNALQHAVVASQTLHRTASRAAETGWLDEYGPFLDRRIDRLKESQRVLADYV